MRSDIANSSNFYLNVELAAPQELHNLVRTLQRSVVFPDGTAYLPGESWCPVHLPLSSTSSSWKAIGYMVASLRRIAKGYRPIATEINGIGCFRDGSIYLKCEWVSDLVTLHREIVNNLNPLRDIIEPPTELAREFSKEQIVKYKEVGDPFSLENFTPHVTIATLDDYKKAVELSKRLTTIKNRVTFSRIGLRIWESQASQHSLQVWESVLK